MIIKKFGVPDFRSPEQIRMDEATAAIDDKIAQVVAPLFELDPRQPEPSSCTGTGHEHRWLKFGPNGERLTYVVHVDAAGYVDVSEQAIAELLTEAGFSQHDPDQVEQAAQRRKFRALERLRDGLMESLNGRAR